MLTTIFTLGRFEVRIESWSTEKAKRIGADYSANEPHYVALDGALLPHAFDGQSEALEYVEHAKNFIRS